MELTVDENYYKNNKELIDNMPDLKKVRIQHIHDTIGTCGNCCGGGPRGHIGRIGPTGPNCNKNYYVKAYSKTIIQLEKEISSLQENPLTFLKNPYQSDKYEIEYFFPEIEEYANRRIKDLKYDLKLQKKYLSEYL